MPESCFRSNRDPAEGSRNEMQRLGRLELFYFDVPALRPGSAGAYAFAFLATAVVTVVRIAIDPYVTGILLITFLPAIVITALISGFGAGIFCVVLTSAAADFFLFQPRWSFYIARPADALDLLALVLVGVLVVIIIVEMRAAIERYRELRRKLEHRVDERTVELADARKRLQHEATFRAMFNISSVGKVEVEPETGRFLRANDAICKFVGYNEAELLARTVFDISHPNYCDRDRELLRRLLAGDSDFDVETRYICKDGGRPCLRPSVSGLAQPL
jgi:PAS domain S-box-containing protein